ncbi:acyl carrier protein [Streptomyces sp. NPDC020742]|uniref:acyl carrier protein n=1 Tax=unclassified Streptomyces TaxID=2593676 RepID=UPI0033E0AE28
MSETVPAFTLADLKKAMLAAVGDDDSIDLDRDILDTPMSDLGFDSLALMNVADVLERDHGICIPDDSLEETMATPRKALAYIEELRVGAAA